MEKIYPQEKPKVSFTIIIFITLLVVIGLFYLSMRFTIQQHKNNLAQLQGSSGHEKSSEILSGDNDVMKKLETVMESIEPTLSVDENKTFLSMGLVAMLQDVVVKLSQDRKLQLPDNIMSIKVPSGIGVLNFGEINYDNFLLNKETDTETLYLFALQSKIEKDAITNSLAELIDTGVLMQYVTDLSNNDYVQYKQRYLIDDLEAVTVNGLIWHHRVVDNIVEYLYFNDDNNHVIRVIFNGDNISVNNPLSNLISSMSLIN